VTRRFVVGLLRRRMTCWFKRHVRQRDLIGLTRKAVVALAEARQLRVEERTFSIRRRLAPRAFITSAIVRVRSGVVAIDGQAGCHRQAGPDDNA